MAQNHRPYCPAMRSRTFLPVAAPLIAVVLVLSSCGWSDTEPGALVATAEATTVTAAPTIDFDEVTDEATQGQEPLVFADTVGEYCGGSGDSRIEMAFAATVTDRTTRAAYANVDSDDPSGSSGRDVEWAAFAVDTWYTDDLGVEIGLWAEGFPGQVGEHWLIAASRYSVDGQPGGDVYWCASEPMIETLAAEWAELYGGSVAAGDTEPESAATPETLAAIEQARALWNSAAPPSYTYTASVGSRETDGSACGSGSVRAVVVDGSLVQARDVLRHCDVPLDSVPSVDALFDLATQASGAVQAPIEFDSDYGFITSFYASDRSVERWIDISDFVPAPYPLTLGGAEALNEARTRWQQSGITSYIATIDVRCFCDVQGPITVTVEDGLVTEVSVEATEWYPLRIEEVFDGIEELIGGDHAELAFHPEYGYPVTALLDPLSNASDDEIDYAITALTPLPSAGGASNGEAAGD